MSGVRGSVMAIAHENTMFHAHNVMMQASRKVTNHGLTMSKFETKRKPHHKPTCLVMHHPIHDPMSSTAPTIPASPKFQYFRILDLPREIRDEIYFYALRIPDPVYKLRTGRVFLSHRIYVPDRKPLTTNASNKGGAIYQFTEKAFAVLRVNQQIYTEALEVFFRSSGFDFSACTSELKIELCYKLVRQGRGMIRNVRFDIVFCRPPAVQREITEMVLELLPNVRRISVNLVTVKWEEIVFPIEEVVALVVEYAAPLARKLELVTWEDARKGDLRRERTFRGLHEALEQL
ncbi:MAG: hypothetical protein Q9218_005922 [Villophora microphyllina]